MERGKLRLQKVIARGGVSSRRTAERLIAEGRVRVNGRVVTELGTRVDAREDRVEVDGRRLVQEKPVYLVLHKPRGVVSTVRDPEGRPSVSELVKQVGARLFPIGRLDFHTSGVLILTNDGEFCDGLLHPRRDVPKTYVVKVVGEMGERDIRHWEQGVELDDGKTRPAKVKFLRHEAGKTWLEVTLFEGRNQQIRRMGEATGFPVMRLARIAFAGVTAEGLRPGQYRPLSIEELQHLREEFGVPRRVPKVRVSAEVPVPGRAKQPSFGGGVRRGRGRRPHEDGRHDGVGRPQFPDRKTSRVRGKSSATSKDDLTPHSGGQRFGRTEPSVRGDMPPRIGRHSRSADAGARRGTRYAQGSDRPMQRGGGRHGSAGGDRPMQRGGGRHGSAGGDRPMQRGGGRQSTSEGSWDRGGARQQRKR